MSDTTIYLITGSNKGILPPIPSSPKPPAFLTYPS